MTKKKIHASVYTDPTEIVNHLVGLKDVRVLSYAVRPERSRSHRRFEIPISRVCKGRARVRERPVVSYVDLPFGGVQMTVLCKKQRHLLSERLLPGEVLHPW